MTAVDPSEKSLLSENHWARHPRANEWQQAANQLTLRQTILSYIASRDPNRPPCGCVVDDTLGMQRNDRSAESRLDYR
jgi:hypothetical protein